MIASPLPEATAAEFSSAQNPAPTVAALPIRPSLFNKNPPLEDAAHVTIFDALEKIATTPIVSEDFSIFLGRSKLSFDEIFRFKFGESLGSDGIEIFPSLMRFLYFLKDFCDLSDFGQFSS